MEKRGMFGDHKDLVIVLFKADHSECGPPHGCKGIVRYKRMDVDGGTKVSADVDVPIPLGPPQLDPTGRYQMIRFLSGEMAVATVTLSYEKLVEVVKDDLRVSNEGPGMEPLNFIEDLAGEYQAVTEQLPVGVRNRISAGQLTMAPMPKMVQ